jgi:hypothetical protein
MDGSTDGRSANAARPAQHERATTEEIPTPILAEPKSDLLFSRGREFPDGDPRRGPHSLEEMAEAAALIRAQGRWHYRMPDVDWYAVGLQYGRGLKPLELARMFGIGSSSVDEQRRKGKWPKIMSERDRRRLARLVWLAGIVRGAGDDEASRAALRKISEWRLVEREKPPGFELQDKYGAADAAAFNPEEFPDDAYYTDADPRRDDRIAMRSKLDELIARMERDVAHGAAHREAALGGEVADDARGALESAPD